MSAPGLCQCVLTNGETRMIAWLDHGVRKGDPVAIPEVSGLWEVMLVTEPSFTSEEILEAQSADRAARTGSL